jgi:3-hydroxyacyl-[acyl-carrier-protein] dehydratase
MRLEHFEMIDQVVRFDRPARRIEALSIVPARSPVFEGHFPGHPLLPGVLLTEVMAQASGYLLLALSDFSAMPFLMAIDRARFRSFVGPGVELAISAQVEHEGSGYAATRAQIAAGGKPLCDASLRFRTMPFPDGVEAELQKRARAIGLVVDAA